MNNFQERLLVVIPTYNERQNVARLLHRLFSLKKDMSVIVIDDNSLDETWKIVRQLMAKYKNLYIKRRSGKLGLGTAYKAGYDFGFQRNFDYIITMDADFSHNPEVIPLFLREIHKADLVIGSRYVKGGGIRNWSLFRHVLSKGANLFTRIALGFAIKDWTSGYRCYRARALETIDLNSIRTSGYSFLVEILFMIKNGAFKIREIPILFEDRQFGKSKISKSEIIKGACNVFRLGLARFRKNQ